MVESSSQKPSGRITYPISVYELVMVHEISKKDPSTIYKGNENPEIGKISSSYLEIFLRDDSVRNSFYQGNSWLIIIDSGLPKVSKDIDERIWKAAEEFVRPEDMEYNHVITSTAGSSFDEETDYNG